MAYNNALLNAGDFNLDQVEIISYRNHADEGGPMTMDIAPITIQVELIEDITEHFLSGAVTVYDTQDVRTVLPLTGLERLILKFNTPGMPGYAFNEDEGVPFQIYKIEKVKIDDGHSRGQYYKIHFTSPEAYFNDVTRVSQAFEGVIEDAIDTLLRQKNYLNSKKPLFFEPTKSNTKNVIPNLKPIDTIDFLSDQARSSLYANSGYMFYETAQGFHFRSIESMLAMGGSVARPARWSFSYGIQNLGKDKVEEGMNSVKRYELHNPIDMEYTINEGAYASRLVTIDHFNKKIETTDFDYSESFKNHFHTDHRDGEKTDDQMVLPLHKFADTGKDLSQMPLSKLMVMSETAMKHNDYEDIPQKELVQQQISQNALLNQNNVLLLVNGNTMLRAGDIINFNMPLMRPVLNGKEENNPYQGGRYLLRSIKHTISLEAGKHDMVLHCMKDSVRTPYPIETGEVQIESPDRSIASTIYDEDSKTLSNIEL